MDPLWIFVAFLCGFAAKQINLPPLIGYLVAGFGLNMYGVQPTETLEAFAQMGITLLLFTIGLKLSLKSLIRTEILATSACHMGVMVAASAAVIMLLATLGLPYFTELNWHTAALVGFAVSFSSTVVVFKILEDMNEVKSRHGQIAIGILILQDIAAVVFLTLTSDKTPSLWAFALLALPFFRPLFHKILSQSGHGEVLPLTGFFLALGGGELFELVGLKADLGALVFGIMLSGHIKATELSKSLLHFKDLFLIGFFLSIGFIAVPTLEMVGAAVIINIALILKFWIFFLLLTGLKVRARPAYLSSLNLSNLSEFGLIVMSYSVYNGVLSEEWFVIIALAVAFSFLLSSSMSKVSHHLYSVNKVFLHTFERKSFIPGDTFTQPKNATTLIVGMGRVGSGAYDEAHKQKGNVVWGVDLDIERVIRHTGLGRQVIKGDAEDYDFWNQIHLNKIETIMLALPSLDDMLEVIHKLKNSNFKGTIAAVTKFEDDRDIMLKAGADITFNVYAEAGFGFADETFKYIEDQKKA